MAAVDNPAVVPVLAAEPLHPDTVQLTDRGGGGASLGLLERVLALLVTGQCRPRCRSTCSVA